MRFDEQTTLIAYERYNIALRPKAKWDIPEQGTYHLPCRDRNLVPAAAPLHENQLGTYLCRDNPSLLGRAFRLLHVT